MRPITIPGLGGTIQVSLSAHFDPVVPGFAVGRDFESTPNKNYATYLMPDRKVMTNLVVRAHLLFPHHTWKPAGSPIQESAMYTQAIEGIFTNIALADGKITFSDPGPISLEGNPPLVPHPDDDDVAMDLATNHSIFRYLGGQAWLHTSNNAQISVVKIKLVLGSQDVHVFSWEEGQEDAQVNFGAGGGGDANQAGSMDWVWGRFKQGVKVVKGVVDTVRKLAPSIEWVGAKDSSQTGRQWTPAQLSQTPEWTLALVMPERKPAPPPPGPFGLEEPFKVYFDTGKSNADAYRSPLTANSDQIKQLRQYMEDIDRAYGLKNVESAEVVGYASGLGDNGPAGSRPNVTLSAARAQYIADLLASPLFHLELPRNMIKAKGSPIMSNGKDNRPEDRRAELFLKIKGGTPRKVK